MNSTIVVNISDNNGPSTTSTTMTSSSSSPPSSQQQQQQMENTFLSSTKSLVNDNSISRHNTSPSTSSSTSSSTNITQYYQSQVHNNSNNIHNNSNVNNLQELIAIKSKFEAEFRRFSLQRSEITNVDDFHKTIEHFHKLFTIPFTLAYIDPIHGDLLPINNDINFALAIASAKPLLRLVVQRKDGTYGYIPSSYGNSTNKKNTFLGTLLPSSSSSAHSKPRLAISAPEDFRQVSSIIDVDIVPDTCRRVRLVKHGSDKPLGFYIRDGTSVRVTAHGVEKVPGIFISRLIPGGLAESTGLLAVNDEVLEVNGIEVNGKSLDQVTDMMVANSSNLIITIRPANQRGHTTLTGSFSSNTISSPHHQHHHPHHQLGGYSANQTNSLERPSRGSKAKSLIVTGPGGTMMATSTGFSGRDNVTSTMGGGVLGGGGLTIGDFHNPHHHHHHHHDYCVFS
ncbi:Partitioning defective 6 beta [Blomia tropicalis]|nr:Partitioning defective 6 beta [Blomia tropicalis]